ncbi:MAG: ATPase [Fervidicoccaceae archaeon]|uniref:Dph6-related ATP pyrophosphatase n=1 Tax=Desulfurococcus sp. TaxID=51678 RepID=UPI003167285D
MRVAFVSGGKDSYYAVYKYGGVDLGVMLVYDFPRPSPHTVNIGKSLESLLACSIPVLVAKLSKGREFEETADLLKRISPTIIVAGDVYVEDHLKYMERLAKAIGSDLAEPLWSYDPVELLYREIRDGIRPVIIGAVDSLKGYLGKTLTPDMLEEFVRYSRTVNVDPLGEHGEYHTLVSDGPLHKQGISFRPVGVEDFDSYSILRLI